MENRSPRTAASLLLLLTCLFGATLFLRSPDLLLTPRFWAEEATHYYAPLQSANFETAATLIINGNYQLLTNLIAYVATLFPAEYAAHVSSYASFAVALGMAALLGWIAVQRNWPTPVACIAIVALALLPQGYEVYLSLTNAQWVCSVCMLFILVLNLDSFSKPGYKAILMVSVLLGLTGVTSAMLAPAFLARRWFSPSPRHFVIGLILAGCAALQLAIILQADHPLRSFVFDGSVITRALVGQTIIAPLFGPSGYSEILAALKNENIFHLAFPIVLLIGVAAPLAALVYDYRDAPQDRLFLCSVIGCWLLVTILNIFGSIGDQSELFSHWFFGSRYFIFGAACFLLLVADAASKSTLMEARASLAIVLLVFFTGLHEIHSAGVTSSFRIGPSWAATVNGCAGLRPCEVGVPPGGPDWKFALRRP